MPGPASLERHVEMPVALNNMGPHCCGPPRRVSACKIGHTWRDTEAPFMADMCCKVLRHGRHVLQITQLAFCLL